MFVVRPQTRNQMGPAAPLPLHRVPWDVVAGSGPSSVSPVGSIGFSMEQQGREEDWKEKTHPSLCSEQSSHAEVLPSVRWYVQIKEIISRGRRVQFPEALLA